MTKRVVVTGATSFLGRYIIDELRASGCQIFAIIRPTSKNANIFKQYSDVETLFYEMADADSWSKAIGTADYFMHLGWDGIGAQGRANPEIQERNVSAAIACMKGAAVLGCKAFLFAGSQAEYGPKTEIITEEDICAPIIEYGKGKLKVYQELSALADKMDICYYHARIFSVYGEGDHPWTLIPSCIRTLCEGKDMNLSSCIQFWNYMYAADAARVLCTLLMSAAEAGIYNIASHDTRRLKEFVLEIYEACGERGNLIFDSYHSTEEPVSLQPDISKLEKAVKTCLETTFKERIVQMVNQYRTSGER